MHGITRTRRRLRHRRSHLASGSRTSAIAGADISWTIRRLVEARERARATIEELKRKAKGADLNWVQNMANEIVTTANFETVLGKLKDLQLPGSGADEKLGAVLVVLAGIEKLLAAHKKYHRDVVIGHLKATAGELAQRREAHKRDRAQLAARLENILLELKELDPDALSDVKAGKG